jgi:hypothetical protein
MKRRIAFVLLPFILISFSLVYILQAGQTNESGCVKCHTNEQMLKALHKPVKSDSAEGEG